MKIAKLFPIFLLLSGCASVERINADGNTARVSMAAYEAQAAIQAEQARTQAAIGVAQASAMADVSVNAMWAAQVPWVVMAVCLTVIILAIFYWRGRIAVQRYEPAPRVRVLPGPERQAILDFAQAHGGQIVWTPDGKPLLQQIDGQRRQLRITEKE